MTVTPFFPHLPDAPAFAAPLSSASPAASPTPCACPADLWTRRVCRAADLLTALDVRVRVVGGAVPWPRLGRVVVSDHTGWLGDLALSTAAPGTPVLGRDPTRALPVGSVACPVVLRYRTAAGYLTPPEIPRTLAEIAAAHDLVVEVHRLPALSTAPGLVSAA